MVLDDVETIPPKRYIMLGVFSHEKKYKPNLPETPRALRFSVEGLNHEGTVVRIVPQRQKSTPK
jgi:hypothetical protein